MTRSSLSMTITATGLNSTRDSKYWRWRSTSAESRAFSIVTSASSALRRASSAARSTSVISESDATRAHCPRAMRGARRRRDSTRRRSRRGERARQSRSSAEAAVSASWQSDASFRAPNVRLLPFSVCAARLAVVASPEARGLAQRLELLRSVLEELVHELRQELRIVAHALAQRAEHGVVDRASKFRHVRTAGT